MLKKLGTILLLTTILLFISSQLFASTLDTELLEKYKRGWSQLDQWNLFDAAGVDILALEAGSLGSDGHWTNTGATITLDAAPTKFILTYASGQLFCTVLDTDDITGTTHDQTIDLSTDASLIFGDNSDTFTINLDGTDALLSTSDGSIELYPQADATKGTVDFLTGGDVNDYIKISTTTDQPLLHFEGCDGKITATDGTIDFDDENLTTTGTLSSGATTVTSVIIGEETYDVVVDDEHRFTSNDSDNVVESYATTDKDALFQLTSDLSADNGDEWQLKNDDADSNKLLFINDTGGTLDTVMTLATTGAITTTNDINVVNDSASTTVVQDLLKLTSSSTGSPAAGLGAGLVVHIDDEGGVEQQASIDFTLTDVTDDSENCDVIVSANTEGTIREVFKVDTDSTATDNTLFTLTSWTIETDGVRDMLELVLDNTADTATDGFGAGISIVMEDETDTAEEQASIDFVLSDAGDGTEDADIVFSQNIAGTITETVKFDADAGVRIGIGLKVCGTTELSGNVDMYQADLIITDASLGDSLTFDTSEGSLVIAGDLSVDGDDINADGNLTIDAEGGTLALQAGSTDILTIGSLGACLIGNLSNTGNLYVGGTTISAASLKSGTDQSDAGAAAGELYYDTNDDDTVKMGT